MTNKSNIQLFLDWLGKQAGWVKALIIIGAVAGGVYYLKLKYGDKSDRDKVDIIRAVNDAVEPINEKLESVSTSVEGVKVDVYNTRSDLKTVVKTQGKLTRDEVLDLIEEHDRPVVRSFQPMKTVEIKEVDTQAIINDYMKRRTKEVSGRAVAEEVLDSTNQFN